MNPGSVFISHSSRQPDFEMTERLAGKLKEAGLDVWWVLGDSVLGFIISDRLVQHYPELNEGRLSKLK